MEVALIELAILVGTNVLLFLMAGLSVIRQFNTIVRTREDLSQSKLNLFRAGDLKIESGKAAVRVSEMLAELKQLERAADGDAFGDGLGWMGSRKVGPRSMRRLGDLWVDDRFTAKHAVVKIKYAGEAYFKLFETREDLRAVLKLGPRLVIVTARGKALVIDEAGEEKLDDKMLKALFVDAPPPKENKPK